MDLAPIPDHSSHGRTRRLRLAACACFCFSAVVFALYGCLWSVHQGRDFETYIAYYTQMFPAPAVDRMLLLFRTPGAPLFFGTLHDLGGRPLVTAALGLLYALGNTLVFATAARAWGLKLAAGWLGLVCLIPSFNWTWHTVASESLFSFGIAVLTWGAVRACRAPGPGRWAFCGLVVFGLCMVRPSSQLLLALALAPLLLSGHTRAARLRWGLCLLVPAVLLLALYAGFNFLRLGEFTVARGGTAIIPGYRVFIVDRLMSPENGPASRRLAQAVAADLLPRPAYAERGVDLARFFDSGDPAMYNDLIALSDRVFGWETRYAPLRRAALEAVAAHPAAFVRGYLTSLWLVFSTGEHDINRKTQMAFPSPQGNDPLPDATEHWLEGDGGFPHPDPEVVRHARERAEAIAEAYPDITGATTRDARLLHMWLVVSRLTAPLWLLVLPGLGILSDPEPAGRALAAVFLASLLVLAITYLGADTVLQFRNPFDPVFILAGLRGGQLLVSTARNTRIAKDIRP